MHPTWVHKDTPRPHIKTGKLRQDVRTKLSWLMRNTQANGRWVHAHPLNPQYEKSAEAIEIKLNNEFADPALDNEMQLMIGAYNALSYGDNTWICRWHEDGPIRGCKAESISNKDVFPDWMEHRWVIIRRVLTFDQLITEAERIEQVRTETDPDTGEEVTVSLGDGTALRAVKIIKKAIDEDHIFERWGMLESDDKHKDAVDHNRTAGSSLTRHSDRGDVKPSEDPRNALITVLEYHEMAYGGSVAMIIPDNPDLDSANERHLVFMPEQPHPYGMPMVVRWIPNWVDNEFWGFGIPEIGGDMADIEDIVTRALVKNAFRLGDITRVYNRDARINSSYLKKGSGVNIPVSDTVNDIRYLEPPRTDLHLIVAQLMSRGKDAKIGESEQRRGGTGGSNTATEAAIAEQGAQTDDLIIAKTFGMQVIQKIGNCFLHILRVEADEDVMLPDLGRMTPHFTKLLASDFEVDYFVKFAGMLWGGNPAIRQAGLRGAFQAYGATGAANPVAFLKADLRELGFADSDDFINPPQGPEPIDPELENKMVRGAQQIQVSPQDDDRAHMVVHGEDLQRMQEDGTDPVIAQDLQRHLLQHIQSQSMKQQNIGGGGGGQPQGPQPFQPAQAGQPGQPSTFNGRTADVHEQRQRPQTGLAPRPGAAPGRPGVVQ